MNDKPWYASKTIWGNLVGAIATVIASATGFDIPPDAIAGGFAILNVILRAVTKGAVTLSAVALFLSLPIVGGGCSTVRGFIGDNPLIVSGATAVACRQAACRMDNDFDRSTLANQLSACGEIVAAGCDDPIAEAESLPRTSTGAEAIVIEIPTPEGQ